MYVSCIMKMDYYRNFQYVMDKQCTSTQLMYLKNKYRDLVNSNRALDNIQSLRELIVLLEKRCEITPYNMDLLHEINNYLSNTSLPAINGLPFQQTHIPINKKSCIRDDLQIRIYKLLCEQLSGEKLKSFARSEHINLPECVIDSLDGLTIENQIHLVLTRGEDYEPSTWKSRLINGLDQARRKDLRNEISKILLNDM